MKNLQNVTLNSPNIKCEGCRKHIIKTLKHMKGVKKVEVDLNTKNIDVTYNSEKVNPASMQEELSNINYPATLVTK